MTMKIVEVEWEDAMTRDGWANMDEYKVEPSERPALVRSVGYLITNDGDRVTLLQSANYDGRNVGSTSITIPAGCIRKMRTAKLPGKTKGGK